ncbi:MAG TPA: Rv3654c family TadE-like protein [Pedococcus sp.]
MAAVTGGRAERGSGTVMATGVCGVVAMLLAGALTVGAAVRAGHRAQGAADLAALAAAATLVDGGHASACVRAAEVAARNGADLRACDVGPRSTVAVTVDVALGSSSGWGGLALGPAHASARAGPGE